MNRLWRNDRSLLAEQSSFEPRNREPGEPLSAAEGLEVNYLSPEEIHAWPPYTSLPEPARRREALRGRLRQAILGDTVKPASVLDQRSA